jgi:hypothetical protein
VSEPLRTVTFGDLEAGTWGVFWGPFAAIDGTLLPSPTIEGTSSQEDWRLIADGAELTVTAAGPASPPDAFAQLCRVHGQVGERAIDCLGRRGSDPQELDPSRFESVREISAWFEPDEGLALVALRPRKARDHGADVVTAALLDRAETVTVADPRLSTTYAADGRPSRMSLELWLDDEQEQYPRRAAGEAVGDAVSSATAGLEIQAAPLRCHSRGREGTGVYLIARVR